MSPKDLELAFLKARTAEKKGNPAQAAAIYQSVLQRFPKNARAIKGLAALRSAFQAQPPAAPVVTQTGTLPQLISRMAQLASDGQNEEAARFGEALLEKFPDSGHLKAVLCPIMTELKRFDEAEQLVRAALAENPNVAELHACLADALIGQGRTDDGVAEFEATIALNPNYAKAHLNLAGVRNSRNQRKAAYEGYQRAVALDPSLAEAHYGMGEVLVATGYRTQAIESFDRALAIRPTYSHALAAKIHHQMHLADWRAVESYRINAASLSGENQPVSAFSMAALDDDPAKHRKRAASCVKKNFKQHLPAAFPRPQARPERLRIGYVSSDFHDHPVLILMAGMLREHDKSRFEIHAYAFGPAKTGPLRDALIGDVDQFTEIGTWSNDTIVAKARADGLDIAIDLGGYTQNSPTHLFQYRLAPIQIGYLGYPGTIGADFFDYIMADQVVIPPAERAHYAESLLALPHSYLPSDNRRAIAAEAGVRADYGLPQHGFVFCCFNNTYKITPHEFGIWCRLLGQVEGSVLWLQNTSDTAKANLRREAQARGIAPERVIFAERLEADAHLARHAHADLFLDTFAFNAHTTSSDALWAGLPLITREGRSFPARVASSVLQATGLPELVTRSDSEYEALALALARDPARLAAIRAKLAANRLTTPMFDTAGFTRGVERGYDAVHARFMAGLPPADIAVA